MTVDLKALRRKVRQLSGTGRGRRIPEELREKLARAARELRSGGRTWTEVAEALGISHETARRYGRGSGSAALVPVRVVEEEQEQPLVLVSPGGYRVEGLTLVEAASLLRALP